MTKKTEFSAYKIIQKEIERLKPNEKTVVMKRFGFVGNKKTLASIGRELNLSRERVRQIEKEAMKRLSAGLVVSATEIVNMIVKIFEDNGGMINKKEIFGKVFGEKKIDEKEDSALNLIIALIPSIEAIENHEELHDSWVLAEIPKDEVVKILNDWSKYLKDKKQPQKIDVLLEAHPDHQKHKISFLSALPKVSKKIIETYEGKLGLSVWPEVNPRTVRDKIYYVLRKNQSLMHFSEIARSIKHEQFDEKNLVVATVHNELIADKRFVLVGRGIYALREWGYVPGTVKDIITKVLKDAKGALSFEDIFEKVLKQRQVRKNTILINLQTQKEFKKIGDGKYMLA